ncbi:hypothetical protein [Mucilaginibacter gilvus]|uniref:Lipoprotein n=1 Tax=Mucilaginibacter gilvus TaxID=2305909 RepID=A0A3S3UTT8_9SPHI|nr:hypothetical protein [Mucilaginibacter gilvus]RWY54270.1 hypothetical protein EPL05_09555 [Mucilaginibacter gilvus]
MRYLSLLILVVSLALSACKKDGVDTDYDKSYSAWLSFKKSSNNSYSYVTYYGSVFGYHSQSKITVQNGKVVGRDFLQIRQTSNAGVVDTLKKWAESGAALNTHENGFAALTLNQVYAKAKGEWLNVNKTDNYVYLETTNNGIISSAGYVPKNCADDCFIGINIKDVNVYVKEIK